MALWLQITLLILNLANVVLHGTGSYLLLCLHEKCRFKIQQRYLVNLSICEFLMNFFECLKIIRALTNINERVKYTVVTVEHYVIILQFCGISLVFYLDMFYITFDRLFEIILHIRYPVYWNEDKAKKLLLGTWVVAGLTTLSVSLGYGFIKLDWEPYIYIYCFPTLEFSFIAVAVTTYIFIFHKYKQTRVSPVRTVSISNQLTPRTLKRRRSSYYIFRRSKFFIPMLLILSFLIFMVAADLTYLFVGVLGGNNSVELWTSCFISYSISNLVDAYIYIYLQKDVRRLLIEKMAFLSSQTKTETSYLSGTPPATRRKSAFRLSFIQNSINVNNIN